MGYSNNSHAYPVYNLRTSIAMESIIVFINDSSATKLVKFEDNDVFGDWDSFENTTDNIDTPTIITHVDPLRNIEKDE